ncbi:MAG: LCP family protein [Solirubrobacteraceae bacterium]|nr:LCP family protein [Solirubrobacteraceae bacterium]
MSVPPLDHDRPPRPGLQFVLRFVLAGMLLLVVTGSAVAATLWNEGEEIAEILQAPEGPKLAAEDIDALTDVEPGKPQTILLVGDDRRKYGLEADDKKSATRSDTMILVRLDPDAEATTMLSLPRDLIVDHVNGGRGKLNQAYEGGPKQLIETLQRLLSSPGEDFPIHHFVSIQFTAFSKAVNEFNCFYADIDRTYFNPPNSGYAEIDVQSGYQRLCGEDSLDYVRFRHADSDLVREARQTHYLAEARAQIAGSRLFADRKKLLKAIRPHITTDIRTGSGILGVVKLATGIVGQPTKRVTLPVTDTADGNLSTTPGELLEAADEFLHPKAPPGRATRDARDEERRASGDATATTATKVPKAKRKKGKNPGTLIDGTLSAKGMIAGEIQGKLKGLPIYYPTLMTRSGAYDQRSTRQYDIQSRNGRTYPWVAYRLVVKAAGVGQYYGIQGTSWADPPILQLGDDRERLGGKTFLVQYDGSKIRRMIYRGKQGTYWITNTLSNNLSNAEMRALARTLTRYRP